MRDKKNTHRFFARKPQGKTPLGIHRHRKHGYLLTPSFFFFFCLLFFCLFFVCFLHFSFFLRGLEITNFRRLQGRIKIRQNPPTDSPVEACDRSDRHDHPKLLSLIFIGLVHCHNAQHHTPFPKILVSVFR